MKAVFNRPEKPKPCKVARISVLCPQAHDVGDPNQLAPPIAFFHLTVDQTRSHLPPEDFPPSATHLAPVSEMGGQRVEVEVEPITGKERKTAWGQHLSQGVNHRVGHVLGAGTQLEDGQQLGAQIDDQPEPLHLTMAAQSGSEFI
jgi:hypothetical protein